MAKVGIVTDTIASLTPEKVKEYGIRRVPVTITINGKSYRDLVDLSSDGFWKLFPKMKEFGAAAPALAEYTNIFKEMSQTTDNIACTFVSKGLSATYEIAVQARDLFLKEHPGVKIDIIDSRTAAGAQGFITLEMARAAAAGKSLAEVVQVANAMIPRVRFVCALETMKLLIKIGRAPKTAYMGELFQVKPIIGMVNNTGLVENLGRARGMEKTMLKMLELMEQYVDRNKPAHVNVHYSNSIGDGEQLKKLVTSRFNCAELYFTPYSPVMCGAVGPVVAISFYS
jgi:fatty acid kinase fatty acid binding subunit